MSGRGSLLPDAQTFRDSGYGTLLRNVAASIKQADPDAAQAVLRASVDVEETISELLRLRETVERVKASEVVELYGLRWAKDGHYYAAAEALGIEDPSDG
jgi:hypothetical protein